MKRNLRETQVYNLLPIFAAMPTLLPSLVTAGAGLLGGITSAFSQKKTNERNIAYQQSADDKNIAFQRQANAQNVALQRDINNQNIGMQRETNAQNEMLTRETWARDDNATQRRVADLKAAGLSATLAAGSPAGVSQPIRAGAATAQAPSVDAPSVGVKREEVADYGQSVGLALQALQMHADYSMTRAQTNLINMQAEKAKIEGVYARKELQYMRNEQARKEAAELRAGESHLWERQYGLANMDSTRTRTSIDQYELQLAKQWNVSTHNSGIVSQILPVINAIQGAFKEGTITNDIVNKVKDELIPYLEEKITQGRGTVGAIDSFLNLPHMKYSPLGLILRRFTGEN